VSDFEVRISESVGANKEFLVFSKAGQTPDAEGSIRRAESPSSLKAAISNE